MAEGFCLAPDHQNDTEIDLDGRCLIHHERTLPPSTSCCHVRWISGTGWSTCNHIVNNRPKACAPRAAGTWRAVLGQQKAAVTRNKADRAARELFVAQKGRGNPRVCRTCQETFVPRADQTRRNFCSDHCRHADREARRAQEVAVAVKRSGLTRSCGKCGRAFVPRTPESRFCSHACGGMQKRLTERICLGCDLPFKPRKAKNLTCSISCGQVARHRKNGVAA